MYEYTRFITGYTSYTNVFLNEQLSTIVTRSSRNKANNWRSAEVCWLRTPDALMQRSRCCLRNCLHCLRLWSWKKTRVFLSDSARAGGCWTDTQRVWWRGRCSAAREWMWRGATTDRARRSERHCPRECSRAAAPLQAVGSGVNLNKMTTILNILQMDLSGNASRTFTQQLKYGFGVREHYVTSQQYIKFTVLPPTHNPAMNLSWRIAMLTLEADFPPTRHRSTVKC